MNLGTQDVGISITAAGTTQATAKLLINGVNTVTTVASGAGVVLFPPSGPGVFQLVYNGGANALKVYPSLGYQINALGANNAMVLATGTAVEFWVVSDSQVVAFLSA